MKIPPDWVNSGFAIPLKMFCPDRIPFVAKIGFTLVPVTPATEFTKPGLIKPVPTMPLLTKALFTNPELTTPFQIRALLRTALFTKAELALVSAVFTSPAPTVFP